MDNRKQTLATLR